jgi:HTH-type transcriptional regulator / antitoxin HigA
MNAILLDERKYKNLLTKTLPVVIQSEDEYRRMLGTVEILMETPDAELSMEEGRLLELLSMLVEEYEDRTHPLPKTTPHKMLAYLLEAEGMSPRDLAGVLPKSRVSEILRGKRGISKSQAKQLAELFRVPVEVFL